MSAFGGMEQSESLISTKGGMCHEYKSNIPLFSRNGMRYVQFLSYSQTCCLQVEYFKNLSCESKGAVRTDVRPDVIVHQEPVV